MGWTWNQQQALINSNEEVPTANVMVYTIIGHYLNTEERLYEDIIVRTSSFLSDGSRVAIGDFHDKRLYIVSSRDHFFVKGLGLSIARK
jgi:hypothetical protein